MVKVDNVAGAGKGFFTEAGQLKSKNTLKTEETKEARKSTEVITSESSTTKLDKALGQLKADVYDKANRVISDVNRYLDDIKSAQSIVKAEKSAAQELKAAIKDGDNEKADKARAEIEKLEEKRSALAQQIEERNTEQLTRRHTAFHLGSEQKGRVEVKQVKFKEKAVEAEELDKKKDVNAFIDELDQEAESLKTQRLDQRETRAQVKEIMAEVDSKMRSISDKAVRSYEDAEQLSERLGEDIKAGAQKALEAFTSPKQTVVSALLET